LVYICLWLVSAWLLQATALVILKYGSGSPARWLPCFVVGNVFGIAGTWFFMLLYTRLNANVALGVAAGGGFLCAQVAIALVFKSHLAVWQYAGILAIAGGMALLAAGGAKPAG
jgi:multidrug transporter EmrE-like cation transporter